MSLASFVVVLSLGTLASFVSAGQRPFAPPLAMRRMPQMPIAPRFGMPKVPIASRAFAPHPPVPIASRSGISPPISSRSAASPVPISSRAGSSQVPITSRAGASDVPTATRAGGVTVIHLPSKSSSGSPDPSPPPPPPPPSPFQRHYPDPYNPDPCHPPMFRPPIVIPVPMNPMGMPPPSGGGKEGGGGSGGDSTVTINNNAGGGDMASGSDSSNNNALRRLSLKKGKNGQWKPAKVQGPAVPADVKISESSPPSLQRDSSGSIMPEVNKAMDPTSIRNVSPLANSSCPICPIEDTARGCFCNLQAMPTTAAPIPFDLNAPVVAAPVLLANGTITAPQQPDIGSQRTDPEPVPADETFLSTLDASTGPITFEPKQSSISDVRDSMPPPMSAASSTGPSSDALKFEISRDVLLKYVD